MVVKISCIPGKEKTNHYDLKTMISIFIGIEELVLRDVKIEKMNIKPGSFIINILNPILKLDQVVKLQKSGKKRFFHFDNA